MRHRPESDMMYRLRALDRARQSRLVSVAEILVVLTVGALLGLGLFWLIGRSFT